jgi:hypothetical protein
MFWFTTLPEREMPTTRPVVDAIRTGAQRTSTDFDYLLKTAQRESSLDPAAQARTSSATGLFQFIEQTWLSMVQSDGAKAGLDNYSQAIVPGRDGRLTVADPALKREILDLRRDPQIAALMAGSLTQRNRDSLAGTLGREPTAGELYAAHVLGARGASDLIKGAAARPTAPAAAMFPDAAAANRSIFHDKSGRARGLGEVYALLVSAHESVGPANVTGVTTQPAPLGYAARSDEPAMFGLFRTEGRRGPVSDAVAKLWTSRQVEGSRVATAAAVPFFPRSGTGGEPPVVAGASSQQPAGPVLRDGGFASVAPASAGKRPEATRGTDVSASGTAPGSAAGSATRAKRSRPAPLDLSQFMVWRSS